MWKILSAAIKTVLIGVVTNGVPTFLDVNVLEYSTTDFTGTPAVTIVPSDSPSAYSTIVQNLRTYVFDIDIYYPLQTSTDGLALSYSVMRDVVDAAVNALDLSNSLNNNALMVRPVPSSWALVAGSKGTFLSARIKVSAAVSVSTNNG